MRFLLLFRPSLGAKNDNDLSPLDMALLGLYHTQSYANIVVNNSSSMKPLNVLIKEKKLIYENNTLPRFERFNLERWYGKGAGKFFVKQFLVSFGVNPMSGLKFNWSSVRVATDSRYAAINAESLLNKLFQAFLHSDCKQHPNL